MSSSAPDGIHCRHIVGYIGVGSTEEHDVVKHQKKESCYLVQEFMNGGSLKAKIWRQVCLKVLSCNFMLAIFACAQT